AAGPFGLAELGLAALALIGAIAAQAGASFLADWLGGVEGASGADRGRMERASDPLRAGGLGDRRALYGAAVAHAIAGAVLLVLVDESGSGVAWFALAGFALSLGYAIPALSLRDGRMGEISAAILWGPIVTVGAFYAQRGAAPPWVWAASLPYGLV